MVRMLQFLIGEKVLRNGLMQYLKSNVYDVTTMHNLWEILFTVRALRFSPQMQRIGYYSF